MITELINAFIESPLRFRIIFFISLIAGPYFLIKSHLTQKKYKEINLLAGIFFIILLVTISLIILQSVIA